MTAEESWTVDETEGVRRISGSVLCLLSEGGGHA